MSAAKKALAAAKSAGVTVAVRDGKLLLKWRRKPTFELIARLKENKQGIVELLSGADEPAAEAAEQDAFEERAAILEYDAGAPRQWAEAKAWFDEIRQPRDLSGNEWIQARQDADFFYHHGWPDRAAALGLTPSHFFGFGLGRRSPREPLERAERAGGLLWLLKGQRVADLTAISVLLSAGIAYRRLAGQWTRQTFH
jgi:hypothetical protein